MAVRRCRCHSYPSADVVLGRKVGEAESVKHTLDGLVAALKVEAERANHTLRTVLLSPGDLHHLTTLLESFAVQGKRRARCGVCDCAGD